MKRKKVHERDIQSDVLNRLHLLGGKWFKIEKAHPNGCPDIVGWYKGKGYAIEMKIPGKAPRFEQDVALLAIKFAGEDSVETTSATSLKEVIDFVRS